MSVIIRLQGLPWSASAMNIRHFFSGLNIPAGGVHIIGGEGGDAFIAFSSDDDARMAMKKNLCPLNGTQVQLFLSSKSEMQSVIDAARSGSSANMPAPLGQNMQQQQRPQFQNMPGGFPMDNQSLNNTNVFAGQMNEFNQPLQPQNQFAKNDWQGFQMYGGHMDDQAQQVPNNFQHNQRMGVNQVDGRFPSNLGANQQGLFGVSQQDKAFPDSSSHFHDASNQMQQPAPLGIRGMPQGAEISNLATLNPKQSMFGEQIVGRPGATPGNDNPVSLLGNIAPMGRGQSSFPGQVNIGPNRNAFNASLGRPIPGKDITANIPGNRGSMSDGILGRGNNLEDKSLGESAENLGIMDKFTKKFSNDSAQASVDSRKASDVMDWAADDEPDERFPGSQKLFDQDIQGDKLNINREKVPGPNGRPLLGTDARPMLGPDGRPMLGSDGRPMLGPDGRPVLGPDGRPVLGPDGRPNLGLDGRPFQQFPFRGEHDLGRMNRPFEAVDRTDPLDSGDNRLMERQERDSTFPGRENSMGNRFSLTQDPEGQFNPDKITDRSINRFSDDQEESLPSTKYPPDSEEMEPADVRPHGRFPPIRGRLDELRYPADDRQFPPEHRFPNEDRRLPNRDEVFPPEHERFPEGGRKFPPSRGFVPDERRHLGDDRRFPPGPDSRRFPPDEGRFPPDEGRFPPDEERFPPEDGRFPPEDRLGIHQDRMRPDEFVGRRPGDNPFAPDDIRFRDREEELKRRDAFGRGRRGIEDRFARDHANEGRPDMRPGFRDFDESEENRRFPPDRRFPPERAFRGEEGEEEFRGPTPVLNERRGGMSRWDRERFEDWNEDSDNFSRPGGPRGPLSDNPDFPGVRRPGNADLAGPIDMDQRAGHEFMRSTMEGRRGPMFEGRGGPGLEGARALPDPDGMRVPGAEDRRAPGLEGFRAPLIEGRGHPLEGMRGRGIEGMRGRGMDGMRGRGGPGLEGRRGPLITNIVEENSFDYGHGAVGRGRQIMGNQQEEEDEEFDETLDFDNRFRGPADRTGMFDRLQRGRGDAFFNRGRPGQPLGRGRGLDMDRRFEDVGPPEARFNMDVDARNVGGRPDGPPIRPALGDSKVPDFSVKPGSGKGLLGDAPVIDRPVVPKPEAEKKENTGDSLRRDLENRSSRKSNERERDHRPSDRRGRDRDDRRSGERDRSRYSRYDRDRNDRRRSRSRERSSRDDGRRSRDRSSSTKKDHETAKSDTHTKSDQKRRNVHMKNFPANVTYKDIRRFLQPIDVPFDGVKIINDKQAQRTDVFIQFRHSEDATRAFRRNGERFVGRPITISMCTDDEYSTATDPANKKETSTTESQKVDKDEKLRYIVQLKNLPLNITKQDIVQFFKGLTIDNNGEAIYIEFDQSGIATGNGFAELKSDYDYKKALTQDGGLMGTVALRVFPGKKEEADELKKKQQEMFQRAAVRNLTGPRGIQPRLQGQSPRPLPLIPQGQTPRPQGQTQRPQGQTQRPQGQTPRPQGQPQRPALIGPRPGMISQQPQSPATQTAPASQNSATSSASDSQDTVCVHIQGLPLLATPQDIREFFSDCQIALRGINIAHDSRGKPLGEGFVEFKFKSDFEKAIKKDKTSLGRHIVAVKPIGKKEMVERLDNARGLPVQQGSQQSQSQSPEDPNANQNQGPPQTSDKQPTPQTSEKQPILSQNPQGQPAASQNSQGSKTFVQNPQLPAQGVTTSPSGSKSIPPGVLNRNWYYVRCQNFPPDISITEILGFFQGFRTIGESIRLHYSSEGKPTGNAVVGFVSPDEAQRALQRLNMKVCRQNVVTLHPA